MFNILTVDIEDKTGNIFYKEKGGFVKDAALPADKNSVIRIKIPRHIGCSEATALFYNETQNNSFSLKMLWEGVSFENDVYELKNSFNQGLHFFYFVFKTVYGNIYGYRYKNNGIVFKNIEKGDRFQLTVSNFKYEPPKSFYGGIMYHIFVDRFAKGNNTKAKEGAIIADYSDGIPEYPKYPGAELKNNTFYGGSIFGITQKLDYISSLGVNILYLSPIFEAASNHKYDTADYMSVDEMFGSEYALCELISEAHSRGIKIILDGVFNHTGADSIYFNKHGKYSSVGAYQSKNSEYYDWYEFQNFPDEYTCWWNIKILPRINTKNLKCVDFFTGEKGVIAKYARLGVDGFRLDVADELSDDFIAKIKYRLDEYSKGSILYGEVWEDASNKIAYSERKKYYLGEELDGVMNYPLREAIIDYLVNKKTDLLEYVLTTVFYNTPKRIRDAQMNILGTHDTERILTVLGGEKGELYSNDILAKKKMSYQRYSEAKKLLLLAYSILATLPGIPTIYYGDEAGAEGYKDPFNRMPYPWGKEDKEILDFYKKIGIIRNSNVVYIDGEFEIITMTRELLIFARRKNNKKLITVINNSNESITISFTKKVKAYLSNKVAYAFVLSAKKSEILATSQRDINLVIDNY